MCGALVLGFVIYSLWPALNAWWSIIDDHRKPMIYNMYHGLSLADIARHFYHAVDFPPLGESPRVQPMFHVLNELELYFFGLNTLPWYGMKLILACIFSIYTFKIFARFYGPVAAALLTVAFLVPSYQAQVLLRLGVAEAYIGPAFAVALWMALNDEPLHAAGRFASAALYTVCLVVMLGNKEVMLILLPAISLRSALDFKKCGWSSPRAWGGVLGLVFGVFILVCLWMALRNQKVDIYGHSLSFADRLGKLFSSAWLMKAPVVLAPIAMLYGFIKYALRRRHPERHVGGPMVGVLVTAALLASAYLGAVFFYNCEIPRNTHYEFPGRMLETSSLFMGMGLLVDLALSKPEVPVWLRQGLFACLAAVCLGLLLKEEGLLTLHREAQSVSINTRAFEAKFRQVMERAKAHPETAIEFVCHGFNDFEPIHSLKRFLRGFGVSNRIVLNMGRVENKVPGNEWETYLKKLLLSLKAGQGEGFDEVTLSTPDTRRIIVYFSQPVLSEGAVANLWPVR
jgi:hypothetical protein